MGDPELERNPAPPQEAQPTGDVEGGVAVNVVAFLDEIKCFRE